MINILEQNVSTTASAGSFGGAGTSSTRTDNPYFEKENSIITTFSSQSPSDYLDNLSYSILVSALRRFINKFIMKEFILNYEVDLVSYARAIKLLKAISKSSDLMQTTALRKLDELKNLAEDWDSYGADPISPKAIAKAKAIIISVMIAFDGIIGNIVQLTDVIPIADGGVQLEWTGPHAELEIEISPDGNIGLLYISDSENRRSYEESEDNSLNDVYTMIGKLILSQYNK